MPSGIALAQAEIPLASSESETGQAPVAPSVMQLPGPHDVSGQPNELGVSVGKGMAPVPRKLAERIWRWEFIEMSEMVAESWSQKVDEISAGIYQYMEDLLALEHCKATPDKWHVPLQNGSYIVTPLGWVEWDEALNHHPDQQFRAYVVSGLRQDFRVGFDYAHSGCQRASSNMHSAHEHAQVIREYLAVECSEGRVVGPLNPPWSQSIQISRFGVIPKGSTVDRAAESVVQLGRGALMAKIDIKAAYRLIPVHPADRWLLGMQFEGAIFMDTVLPFGSRYAPKIFNAVANALEWACRNNGVGNMLDYLDDFMVFGAPDSSECADYLMIVRSVFQWLGVPIAEHKTAGPLPVMTFLGVEIDSEQLTLRLPEEKLTEIRALILSWLHKKVAVARDLKSLVGKLENACKVVRPGRSFLRRMLDLLRGVHSNRRLICLSEAFRSDVLWWHTFLEGWNGISMIPYSDSRPADVVVHNDASGALGCAARWQNGTYSTTVQHSPATRERLGDGPTGLDVSQLGTIVQQLFSAGIAQSTRKTYRSGSDRYIRLRAALGITPFPVSERSLSLFAASLYSDGLAGTTAKTYLSGIRFAQISLGGKDPNIGSMPYLEYVLKGFRKLAAGKSRPRLPITPSILSKMRETWSKIPKRKNAAMFWAASCMCFFDLLRSGEIVVPSNTSYDPAVHLSYGDVRTDSIQNPTCITVAVKASKTDPFRKGVVIHIGATKTQLCPVATVLGYMIQRGSRADPFFMFDDGRALTHERLVVEVKRALERAGVDSSHYSGHSFRIGAATTAAACGLQDSLIKMLGRWESVAYTVYIRTPPAQLCAVAAKLVN
ncbi:hypothetical protein EMCRGX_G015039 [Ephydatia muelleri]